jgi:hypothetical protein
VGDVGLGGRGGATSDEPSKLCGISTKSMPSNTQVDQDAIPCFVFVFVRPCVLLQGCFKYLNIFVAISVLVPVKDSNTEFVTFNMAAQRFLGHFDSMGVRVGLWSKVEPHHPPSAGRSLRDGKIFFS